MLSNDEKKFALDLAKTTLEHFVKEKSYHSVDEEWIKKDFGEESELLLPRGCFVTLKEDEHLRGCIGTIVSDQALYLNIISNAIKAGTQDPRFSPVKMEELSSLNYEISAMGEIRPLPHIDEIVVGKHGLIVRNGPYQGLLLPQVAIEWGWDIKEFVEHTCLKAGLPKNAYLEESTELMFFTADVF